MLRFLLDTNAILYALAREVKLPKASYLVSVITEIELLSYSQLTQQEEATIKKLIAQFESIELTKVIKEKKIEIRKNSNFKLPDSIIAASALVNDSVLVTADKQLLNSGLIKAITLEELLNS